LLDASIEMDSTPGEGTSLRIVFPRSYDPVEPIRTAGDGASGEVIQ